MPFQIEYRSRRVERDLDRFPTTDAQRILAAISALTVDPRPVGSIRLRGQDRAYRIRVGHYRIIYSIDYFNRVVVIDDIVPRNERTYRRR